MSTQETIDLYLTINKLIYKHAELGREIFTNKKKRDVDNKHFKLLLEVNYAIELLLENEDPIVEDGVLYPNYADLEGQELYQCIDFFTYKFDLSTTPYFDFANNTTKINNILNENNTSLPDGGGPGFFLTKDVVGNLIWSDETNLISNFDNI